MTDAARKRDRHQLRVPLQALESPSVSLRQAASGLVPGASKPDPVEMRRQRLAAQGH